MTQPNDPINANAFDPSVHAKEGIRSERIAEINGGLTKREYFASIAMQGMLANNAEGNTEWNYEIIAKHSCKAADALINQLNQKL
jgi:hypothetical protein